MQRLSWLITPSAESLLFALKLCIALASALYLSMWLQLDRPYWASLEVAVMMQPMPGMAVVRGFARAAGTIVAGCVGLLIVALFAQSYELSAAALALWVAFCAFCASLFRNNLSYGFAIAGFITGITVVLSHSIPQPPFDIAVARMAECVLAAVVASAVNVLFSPPIALRAYFSSRIELLRSLAAELTRLAAPGLRRAENPNSGDADNQDAGNPHPALHALVSQSLALEQIRQYVRYESPGFAHFNRLARRLDYDLLALVSSMSSLHVYIVSQAGPIDTTPLAELAEPAARLRDEPHNADAAKQGFDDAYERIIAIARRPVESGRPRRLADWVVLSRALDLVSRCRAALVKHGLLIAERAHPSGGQSLRRSEFSRPLDLKNAFRNSMRTLIAVGCGGVVWVYFHNQLPATLLVILLSSLTTIFAQLPNPTAAAGGFAKGLAIAVVAAFVVDFLILPQATSYAMLMLAMLPVVFVGGLAMASPDIGLALPGRISIVMFSLLVHVQNGALQSFTTFLQIVMGISMAVALTVVAFRLVLPVSPRQVLREQTAAMFGELARGTRISRQQFETRMYDRLDRLPLDAGETLSAPAIRQAVLAIVNMGLETRSLALFAERVGFSSDIAHRIPQEMTALQHVFATPRPILDNVIRLQESTHALAEQMIEQAVAFEDVAARRLAIRASVSAELVASALGDYVLAFRGEDRDSTAAAAEALAVSSPGLLTQSRTHR